MSKNFIILACLTQCPPNNIELTMSFITDNLTTILTYAFLYLTVVLLWAPKFKKISLWVLTLAISTAFGLVSKRITVDAVFFIIVLSIFAYFLVHQTKVIWTRVLSGIAFFVLGAGLEMHALPGFDNLQVLNKIKISTDGIPFSLYLNFDKTIVGIIILGVLNQRITKKTDWIKMLRMAMPMACILIFTLMCLSYLFSYVRFDLKLPHSLLIWSCTNLLFVCIAEEGFFRGFVQKYLCVLLHQIKYGNSLAIIISSLLFGLAHYSGGSLYVILATISGIGYGLIYFRTKRIEASIISHFLLNLVHFLFFTYPALAHHV